MILPRLVFFVCVGATFAQYQPTTTPVPILKQINRHNEDGSYSYGFEAADGSYKIESKYPTGEVYGKYGFIDDTGSLREVEYGASRRGFEPAGSGINVPPPTLAGNSIAGNNEPEDDGQYREDPSIYYTDPKYTNGERYDPVPRLPAVYQQQQQQHQQHQQYQRQQIERQPVDYQQQSKSIAAAYRQAPVPQQDYRPQYKTYQQPQYQASQYRPQHYPNSPIIKRYDSQPTYNIDNLSSYTVQY